MSIIQESKKSPKKVGELIFIEGEKAVEMSLAVGHKVDNNK